MRVLCNLTMEFESVEKTKKILRSKLMTKGS
jgi:hypothetical protein